MSMNNRYNLRTSFIDSVFVISFASVQYFESLELLTLFKLYERWNECQAELLVLHFSRISYMPMKHKFSHFCVIMNTSLLWMVKVVLDVIIISLLWHLHSSTGSHGESGSVVDRRQPGEELRKAKLKMNHSWGTIQRLASNH